MRLVDLLEELWLVLQFRSLDNTLIVAKRSAI